jgi:hypothetical protein
MTTISKKALAIAIGIAAGSAAVFATAAALLITQPVWRVSGAGPAPAVDPGRLEAHTRKLSEEFVPRNWPNTENLDRTAAYIRNQFETAGATVMDQSYKMDGRIYQNVVSAFGPETSDPVIIGAHYDAFGELPGADDNASGVAGLIELAHLLGRTALPARVELVAFTLEEPQTREGLGLFRTEYGGSAVHVRSLDERGLRPRVFINLEMIGYFSDEAGSQGFSSGPLGWLYPSRGDWIAIIGRIGQGGAVRRVKAAMRGAPACRCTR